MNKQLIVVILSVILLANFCRAADLDVIGLGAQSMGMGKNGLALFDDVNTVFLNPSGLSKIDRVQFSSMYTKCLDEINYYVAGGAIPLKYGTLGITYIGSQVPDIPLTTLLADGSLDQDNIAFANYSSSILALSYGLNIGPEEVGLSSGVKFKYFGEDLSKGSASGYDLDFGLRYQPLSWLRLALVQENCLPSSLGASLNWSTGCKESMPTVTKAALGFLFDDQNLGIEAGMEKPTLQPKQPVLYRAGVEWRPVSILAVRVGLDQELVPEEGGASLGTTNNPSYGVGFKYAGFGFDYAFRSFAGYSGNNAHFFSISYIGKTDYDPPSIEYKFVNDRIYRETKIQLGIKLSEAVKELKATLPNGETVALTPNQKNQALLEWAVPADLELGRQTIEIFARDQEGNKSSKTVEFEVAAREPKISIEQPLDRAITSEESIAVSGNVVNGELLLNDEPVTINSDGGFATRVTLSLGINKLRFSLKGEDEVGANKELSVLRIVKEEKKNDEKKK